VRYLSAETDSVLRWFEATHEQAATMGASWWRVAHLPRAGGIGDQDAWLWRALTVVRAEMNAVLWRQLREQADDDRLQRWRDRVREERG